MPSVKKSHKRSWTLSGLNAIALVLALVIFSWLSWAWSITLAVVIAPTLLMLVKRSPKRRTIVTSDATSAVPPKCAPCPGYNDPLRWSFLPSTGIQKANVPSANEMENDQITCRSVTMHRPTHNRDLERNGEYPYSWHLFGRKRLWEIRVQIRFKQLPQSHMFFGVELATYVPASGLTSGVTKALQSMIRSIVGKDLYSSPGDDPTKTEGECEPPTFVMPLWAFDQFAVSEIGEEPDLTGDLSNVGLRRTDGISTYIKAMQFTTANFSTDKVYTFCFWGVSQFADCMAWEVRVPGLRVDFSRLFGGDPIYVGLYELGEAADEKDERHLISRKKYKFRVALWNEQKPPSADTLNSIVGTTAIGDSRKPAPQISDAPWWYCGCLGRDNA